MTYYRQFRTDDASYVTDWRVLDSKAEMLLKVLKLKKLNEEYFNPYGGYICLDLVSTVMNVGFTIGTKAAEMK